MPDYSLIESSRNLFGPLGSRDRRHRVRTRAPRRAVPRRAGLINFYLRFVINDRRSMVHRR